MIEGSANLFDVSPVVDRAGDLILPLLAAKWVLVVVITAVAGPSLAKGQRPEALPKT